MPKSALPENYVIGADNLSPLMQFKKKIQIWLAAGPRVPSGFFRWRDIPILITALRGPGTYRYENTDGTFVTKRYSRLHSFPGIEIYLSRIQPWCRWHISLQWPLFFNFHVIYRQKNVAKYPTYRSSFGIDKMVTFGIGCKRDADKIYWLTMNVGGNFE